MEKLQKKSAELLQNKTVEMIIGYENGCNFNKIRASFISVPEMTNKLIFNEKCTQNLAVYLTKPEIKKMGKIAVVAPIFTMRTILALASENQISDENVLVLGFSQNNELLDFQTLNDVEKYLSQIEFPTLKEKMKLEELEKMTLEEREQFWKKELSKCVKCFACRAACPLCYCLRCAVESNQPQWVEVTSSPLGNFEWHILRAMHLAGRCTGCGNCATACPLNIPLDLLNSKMAKTMKEQFNFISGKSAKQESALSTFNNNDKENFIL